MQYIFIYIYLNQYISIYQNISIYISIYIYWKKERGYIQKNATFCNLLSSFAFFCKRMLHSLRSWRSFTFFAKECCVLCILLCPLQKNVALFAFFYVLKKRMQKNALFFWVSQVAKNSIKERKRTLRSLKECKRTMLSERKRMQCPTL